MDFIKGVRSVLSGEIIMSKLTKRRIAIIALVFGLAVLYVVNHFHGIYIYREINRSEERIEKLRAEGVAIQSELLKKTNRRNSVISCSRQKALHWKSRSVRLIRLYMTPRSLAVEK